MGTEDMTTLRERNMTVRPPTEADILRILDLIAASDIAHTGEADPWSADDLRDDWIGVDLSRDGWVIEAPDGTLVGYGGVKDFGSGRIETDGYVHPAHTGLGVGSELLRRF